MPSHTEAVSPIETLLDIMARLRDPDTGCPWDKAQSFATIAPYTIEEAYEVADAIEHDDMGALLDELGDLLFQVVFYAQMAREAGDFDFDAIARGICEKMLRRHPHVFGAEDIESPTAQRHAWEAHKAAERAALAETEGRPTSILDGVAHALPALMRAHKLQKRAARDGFDWPDIAPVFEKIDEEIAEIRSELAENAPHERLESEVGDLLFACVNLARHLDVDPEVALRGANRKFDRRFRAVEEGLARQGRAPKDATLAEMDALWDLAKRKE